ncbi:MAG: peptidoglycan recognition family protein [Clostridiales bacterium]
MVIPIYKDQIRYNVTKRKRSKTDIKAIVIHYTANYNPGADDRMHFKYWNSGNKNSSCDIVIDHDSISVINDWYKNYCWQIGDGKGKYGYTNSNVIGIEICVNKEVNRAIENTIWYLREHLLKEFDHIDKDHMIRHYDASRKLCPIWMVDLNISGLDPDWVKFRNAVFAKSKQFQIDWKDILLKETSNPTIWIDVVQGLIDIGEGKASGFDSLIKNRTSLKYFSDLIVKIDDNKEDWEDIINTSTTSPGIWKNIINGLIDLGNNDAKGIEQLAAHRSSLKYFATLIEKIDR